MPLLRLSTAGESHGPALVAIVEGLPSGLPVDPAAIEAELRRRQGGYGRSGRQTIERDAPRIISGVRAGRTLGSPVAIEIANKDSRIEELPAVTRPRPGHADLAGAQKYGTHDARDVLERASARETAARVAAGALAKSLLARLGIESFAHVAALGGDAARTAEGAFPSLRATRDASPFYCCDPDADVRWTALVDQARRDGDTLGGLVEIRVIGAPPGLGSHVQPDRKLSSRLAGAVMSVQAIKGVEIGLGFGAATRRGSEVHDEIAYDPAAPYGFRRARNNAGGIEGGMTTGEEIRLRAAKKPISTLRKPLKSADLVSKQESVAAYERSDVTAVPAASVILENVVAFEVASACCEKFGGDSIEELERNFRGYVEQLRRF
ncbi:MAG: chorismate synthase [Planctomycetales bacterium]|nr:chorismate synthase [Planctomycetales bacterium]